MLNFHAKDVLLISAIAGASMGAGFLVGSWLERKNQREDRAAGMPTKEQLTAPEGTLLPEEIAAWANFNEMWAMCDVHVEYQDSWLQDGGRLLPDYWKERKAIETEGLAIVEKFTDVYGRRGLMCRITSDAGFVIYESFISKDHVQPVYLTIIQETNDVRQVKEWMKVVTTVLTEQVAIKKAKEDMAKLREETEAIIKTAQENSHDPIAPAANAESTNESTDSANKA